jgi:hypothetical protein
MATLSIGTLALGMISDVGGTQYGATAGYIDYSRRTFNEFGVPTVVTRNVAKKGDFKIRIASTDLNAVFPLLADLRQTACIWLGSAQAGQAPDARFELLNIYGFYRDLSIGVTYDEVSDCSLSIEGVA